MVIAASTGSWGSRECHLAVNEQVKGAAAPPVQFGVDTSRGFSSWLGGVNASLVVSTYQVGKALFFGTNEDNKLWVHNRNIGRCLGLAADSKGLWITSDAQMYRFSNVLKPGVIGNDGVDVLYAPRFSLFTGDLDAHDLAVASDGRPVFVNTLFNCLATPSMEHSFDPVWSPPFISKLVPEDRCHLNGLAMRDGKPAFVTAVSQSDVFDGWRDHREGGGIVMDVESNEIVCSGLSMPHSPRWHEGRLWLHNSGTGEFGYVDLGAGKFEPVAFCPGYLRGLDFVDRKAVVGLSLPRGNKTFSGLPLDDRLAKESIAPRCGLYVIDLVSGAIAHSMVMQGIVTELYDVAVLEGVKKPAALSPLGDDIKRTLSLPT